jgi:hypothetical protein
MSRKQIAIDHFHVTQQLGFKPVLHCWCGATLDLNQNKRRQSTRRWTDDHRECELPIDGTPTYEKLAMKTG